MVAAAGWEWQKEETAIALARLAVDESNIGVYEDKVAKIQSKTRGTMRDLIGQKTCGMVSEDKEKGFTMVIDRRQSKWQSVRKIIEQLSVSTWIWMDDMDPVI